MTKYCDLEEIISVNELAADAKVWSSWIDGLFWIQGMCLGLYSTCDWTIQIQTRDSGGVTHEEMDLFDGNGADDSCQRLELNIRPGYSFRLGLYNTDEDNGEVKLRAQVWG